MSEANLADFKRELEALGEKYRAALDGIAKDPASLESHDEYRQMLAKMMQTVAPIGGVFGSLMLEAAGGFDALDRGEALGPFKPRKGALQGGKSTTEERILRAKIVLAAQSLTFHDGEVDAFWAHLKNEHGIARSTFERWENESLEAGLLSHQAMFMLRCNEPDMQIKALKDQLNSIKK